MKHKREQMSKSATETVQMHSVFVLRKPNSSPDSLKSVKEDLAAMVRSWFQATDSPSTSISWSAYHREDFHIANVIYYPVDLRVTIVHQ